MREVGHTRKRKSWESKNESNSADSVWVSATSSSPKPKKKRQQPDGKSRDGKDVGDSDCYQLVEGEPFRPATSCAFWKGKLQSFNPDGEAILSNKISRDENNCVSELKGEAMECLTGKDKERAGREDLQPALMSLSTVRTCREALIGELREARTRMLQWMREEMLSMLHEVPTAPRACTSSPGDISSEDMDLEEQVLQLDSVLTSNTSVSPLGEQFGGESNRRSDHGFSRQSGEGGSRAGLENGFESNDVSRAGLESCDQNSVPGDSTFKMHDSGNVGEDVNSSKHNVVSDQRMVVALADSAHCHSTGGVSTERLGNDKEETRQFDVALVDYRADALSGFETQNEQGRIDFALQSDICRNRGEHNFQAQSDICAELGFGVETGNSGALGYGGSSDGLPINFGLHCSGREIGEFSASLGLSNTGSNNAGLGNHQALPFRVSNEDRTPDFMGLQSQTDAVELQTAGALNMVWNMMQQGGRNFTERVCDSGGPSFKYDENSKSRHGEGISGTIMGNGITYDNSSGLFRSATLQNAVSLPMRSASHCFNSVGFPTLITLQNQMAMQNPSTLQNFLDLNVGVGINKQMFPGVYF